MSDLAERLRKLDDPDADDVMREVNAQWRDSLWPAVCAVVKAVEPSTFYCPVCRSRSQNLDTGNLIHRSDCPWLALARRMDEERL